MVVLVWMGLESRRRTWKNADVEREPRKREPGSSLADRNLLLRRLSRAIFPLSGVSVSSLAVVVVSWGLRKIEGCAPHKDTTPEVWGQ